MAPTLKRRLSITSDPGKGGGGASLGAVVNIAQIGLSKSFRRTVNAEKRSQSFRRIFRALVYVVIAIKRLQPRLNQSEVEQIKILYDNAGGVHSVTQLVLLMQHAGIHGTDDVCRLALTEIGYKDGFLMTMEQFRHAFEHCKRDLLAMAKRNDDTLDAFTALGGGEATIDPETMANAIEEFGLTVDVQLIAQGGGGGGQVTAAAWAVSSPMSPSAGGATVSPGSLPLAKPPAVVHKKAVTYAHFSNFFNSGGDDEDHAPSASGKQHHLSKKRPPSSADGWWTKSGDPDDDRWLDLHSSAWSPTVNEPAGGHPHGDRNSPLSFLERLESNLDLGDTATSRASPNFPFSLKSFESAASSPSGGRGQHHNEHTVAASTSNVTSARDESTSSSRTEGSAGLAGLLSDRHHGHVTAIPEQAPPSNSSFTNVTSTTVLVHVGSPSDASVPVVEAAHQDKPPQRAVTTMDDPQHQSKIAQARSPTRSLDQRNSRPLSAVSQRSVSPSSWADFIERSQRDVVARQQRVNSAPSQRRVGGKKEFYVAATLPGACLNPPAAPCYWREAKIEKSVVASSSTLAAVDAAPGGPVNRPPFQLRPTSAASNVSVGGSAARTVRQLQQQRPQSASLFKESPSDVLKDATNKQLMSRWVSGGQLACGDSKPRQAFHRGPALSKNDQQNV